MDNKRVLVIPINGIVILPVVTIIAAVIVVDGFLVRLCVVVHNQSALCWL